MKMNPIRYVPPKCVVFTRFRTRTLCVSPNPGAIEEIAYEDWNGENTDLKSFFE